MAEPAQSADAHRESALLRPRAGRPVLSIDGILGAMRHPLMVAFLVIAALIQVYRVTAALPGRIHEEDFADYYAAATIMRQGENPYHTSLSTFWRQARPAYQDFQTRRSHPGDARFSAVPESFGSVATDPGLLDLDRDQFRGSDRVLLCVAWTCKRPAASGCLPDDRFGPDLSAADRSFLDRAEPGARDPWAGAECPMPGDRARRLCRR